MGVRVRIRAIKPEFFSSLTIRELEPAARLTFIWMWCYSDDEGRGKDDERLLKASIWPLDDEISPDVVANHTAAIERVGLIRRYEVAGRRYFVVSSWHEGQSIARPRPSRLPDESGAVQERVNDTLALEREQGTGNREQGYSPNFERFWTAYPLRKGKREANRAWLNAIKRAEPEVIIAGAERYRDDPNREPGYTKYAEGWLNGDRWLDEALPPKKAGVRNILQMAERAEGK